MRILKKKSCVTNLRVIQIPHYNRGRNYTQAVEFVVHLPQALFNKLVKYWRDEKKEKFWTCRVNESIVYKPYYQDCPDVLGLGKAFREPVKNEYEFEFTVNNDSW